METILFIGIIWIILAGVLCLTISMASSRFNHQDEAAARRHREQVLWKLKMAQAHLSTEAKN